MHFRSMNNCIKFLFAIVFFASCNEADMTLKDESVRIKIPSRFPELVIPDDNLPTSLRIDLGRRLFYDVRLSSGNNVSCGSCHVLSAAFTDGKKISSGNSSSPFSRNSPTLANVGWSPYLMSEGGVPSLELQALAPLHDTMEMGSNMMIAVEKLNKDKYLMKMAKAAYGRDSIDPFVVMRALASFQRTFVSADSRYDRYKNNPANQLNNDELNGMNLFYSEKTGCGHCHSGELFTDFGFYNIGLYEYYSDSGRERKTHEIADNGKFKTPTLRNIALTAPYMHDGSINTIEEVIEFYDSGGKNHPSKDTRIKRLNLTPEEKSQLVAFLNSLTDWNFVQNKNLLPTEAE